MNFRISINIFQCVVQYITLFSHISLIRCMETRDNTSSMRNRCWYIFVKLWITWSNISSMKFDTFLDVSDVFLLSITKLKYDLKWCRKNFLLKTRYFCDNSSDDLMTKHFSCYMSEQWCMKFKFRMQTIDPIFLKTKVKKVSLLVWDIKFTELIISSFFFDFR